MGTDLNPFVLFLTGVSGAGKTTAYKALREDSAASGVFARDIDENGVPPVGSDPWRKFRVELLLHEALQSLKAGISTVICGWTFPHEVTWSESFDSTLNIWIVALQISPEQIETRLQRRVPGRAESDERFGVDLIDRIIQHNIDLQPRLLHAVRVLSRGMVIDTRHLSADESLLEVRAAMATAAGGNCP